MIGRKEIWRTAIATTLMSVLASAASAQVLTGTVSDSASRAGIAGAVVSVIDTASHVTRRVLTGGDGRFRVAIDRSVVLVYVVRIGFRPVSYPLVVNSAEDQHVVLTMAPLTAILPTVKIAGKGNCEREDDRASALAIWEQARQALLASVVARDAASGSMRILQYNRILDGSKVVSQSVIDSAVFGAEGVVSARSASEYVALGYVEDRANGQRYFGPDADVLLDETFVTNHCFAIQQDEKGHPEEVGLAFQPLPERGGKTDIEGVLWIDRDHPALRTLDFTYTGVESEASRAHAGGSVLFRTMSNGIIAIERWNLHVPELIKSTSYFSLGDTHLQTSSTARAIGIRDIGGELASASWPDGTIWRDTLSAISGRVVSSEDGRPMADASVHLLNTSFGTRTDSAGRFVFENILPGPYVVQAADTAFAEFGIAEVGGDKISVERDATAELEVRLRPRAAMIADLCKARGQPVSAEGRAPRLLIEEFLLPDGRHAGTVKFRAHWARASEGQARMNLNGQTDSTGAFVLCAVPSGVPITITGWRDSLSSVDTMLTLARSSEIVTARIALFPPGSKQGPAYRRRLLTVVDAASAIPVGGVEVIDASNQRLIGKTSASGSMSLASLEPGTSLLRLRKIGTSSRIIVVNIAPADTSPMRVSLNSAVELPTVLTSAMGSGVRSRRLEPFMERQKMGNGHFLGPVDFVNAKGLSLGDLLQRLGIARRPYLFGRRQIDILYTARGGEVCPVTIYIDKFLYYHFDPSPTALPPPDLWSLSSDDYIAAEFYAGPSEVPVEYNATGTGCALLLLWSRY